jgi:hypothetical protein
VLTVFFFDAALEADFFLVTFLRESFRLAVDLLPALAVFFLLAFFFEAFLATFFADTFFFVTFFFAAFFLLAFLLEARLLLAFFFEEDLPEDFFPEAAFFLLTFFALTFFLLVFLAVRTAPRLRDDFFATFFETFFLEAAFFLDGMRNTPGGFKRSRRLYIEDVRAKARVSAAGEFVESGQFHRGRRLPGRVPVFGDDGGVDSAAYVEFRRQAGESRIHAGGEIVEDFIGDRLVKCTGLPIRPDIKFQ